MRTLPLIVLIAGLCGFASTRSPAPPTPSIAGATAAAPVRSAPETQPTTKPSGKKDKAASIDDEIKSLGLKPMNLGTAMHSFEKVGEKLAAWGANGTTEFDDARKAGILVAGTAKVVEWKRNRRRTKDPKAFDQITSDLETSARNLAAAAGKKDAAAVKSTAAELGRHCADCHSKFK